MIRGCTVGLLAAVLMVGCAFWSEHGSKSASSGERYNELVVLVPKPSGNAGAIVLRHQGQEVLLDKPYQAALVHDSGLLETSTLSAQEVRREFAGTVAALPARPKVYTVYFVEGKSDLTEASAAQFEATLGEAILAELAARPAPEISVTGHADSVGSDRFKNQLSMARAQRVRDELIKRRIPEPRIVSVTGRGMRDPLIATGPGVAEPRNRRVEISIR